MLMLSLVRFAGGAPALLDTLLDEVLQHQRLEILYNEYQFATANAAANWYSL
jgi:hypothetical protein